MKITIIFLITTIFASPVAAQKNFKTTPPEEMQHELHILKATLTSLHPGIYRYQTRQGWDSIFDASYRKASQPMPKNRYFILIAQLLTNVHCGHTYTNYWNQPHEVTNELYSKSCLPFLFRVISGKMILTHNISANQQLHPGDEIIAINHIPVRQITDSLLTVSPSDGRHGLQRKLDNISIEPLDADTGNFNLFDIYFPLFFPKNFDTITYKLTIKQTDGHITNITVAGLTKAGRLAAYNRKFGKLPVHEADWQLSFLNKNTAIFKIGDFETWDWKTDYKKYLDSVFILLKQKRLKNLIVDIRGNGGGDDEARDEVFSYLTDKPFGCDDPMHRRLRFLSVPDTLMPYLKSWNKSFKQAKNPADYTRLPDSLYEKTGEINAKCQPIQPKANSFAGRKFLIIDSRNSSTTFTLAKLFKAADTGEIVGETTGGNQQGINGGQFFFLYLPHTKIEIDIPLIWGAYDGNRPDTGIIPDHPTPITALSIRKGFDPAIDYILKKIGSRR